MKKTLICIALTMLLLFSCGKGAFENSIAVSLPICVTASLQGSDASFTAEITHECAVVSFEPSHTLAGTVLTISPDGNSVSVGDVLSRKVKKGIFPAQEALTKAYSALAKLEKIESDKKYTIDEMDIIVYYDKDSEQITAIETEENGRGFYFCIHASEPQ